MLWLRFCSVSFLILFNSVVAVIGTPLDVVWTRERDDPRTSHLHEFLAWVDADRGEKAAHVSLNFNKIGDITLRAYNIEESQQPLAETSNHINVQLAGEGPPATWGLDRTSTYESMSSIDLPTESSTAVATPTSVTTPTKTPSSNPSKPPHHTNAAAIAGGVIGGVIFLALLVLGILLFIRRRKSLQAATKRLTFHRDLMVQARPASISISQANNINTPTAYHHGQPAAGASSPRRLPRFSFQRLRRSAAAPSAAPLAAAHSFTPAHAGPTDRQLALNMRVRQLEEMMHEIRYRPGMSRVLEQLRNQVSWLRAQRNSPWALHQTDTKPMHYDLYMTN